MVPEFKLKTPIGYLSGIGPHRSEVLAKDLGIFTFGDLLHYYPFRYIDRTIFHKINQIHPSEIGVQFIGRLVSYSIQGEKRSKRLVALVKDDTGTAQLVWFQGIKWVEKALVIGNAYTIYGNPSLFNNQISISHPDIENYKPKQAKYTFQPVYSSTEKLKRLSLDSKGISKAVSALLKSIRIEETLPSYILEKYKLYDLPGALRNIHFPENSDSLARANYRLKFEEFFFLQLKILKSKITNSSRFAGPLFKEVGAAFNHFYREKLPFELTSAQKRVLKEIRKDTRHGAQMNRLLQGDVGSGKTIVALLSMLIALDNGYQACLMAPTEILAQQHYQGLKKLIGDELRIALLTGSSKQKSRSLIQKDLLSGDLQIIVGTHALLEDKVQFNNLGLAIIDEQHRFGVQQRAKLWRKNTITPHMLVMTATPIPRTLAMTLYGDLDISVIDELPAGRRPIVTLHFKEDRRLRMFGILREEISKGRQVYVVYPLIEESEKLDLLYLEAGLEALEREFPMPTYKVGIVHGRLTPKEKESEMDRFVRGETQILVATTVIEVGVMYLTHR